MFDERIDKIIKSTHKSYCKYVSIIPEITKIETISGNYAEMQFDAKSLYEKNYILKVNESINDENEQFIENILWHEFTHVADSILFNEYEYEDYKHIMYIYSEIHAAELQMNNMLATQMERPCSLEQDIEHKGIITLQKYMDTSLHHALDQFKLPVWYIFLSDNICDAREIYYFIGYLKSLKSHSINYEYSYSDIDERYNSLFKEITEYVLNNQEYDYKHFISLDKQMDKLIIELATEHNQEIVPQTQQSNEIDEEENNTVRCPKCGSTQITTGQRGYSFLTGFLGSNKTVNRCANCGYSWKPGK